MSSITNVLQKGEYFVSTGEVLIPYYEIQRVEINPGKEKEVHFKLHTDDLALITEEGNSIIEKGQFKITVAGSSPDETSMKLGAAKPAEAVFELR